MKIPLTDLKKQYQFIREEINRAIERVIAETSFILGEELKDLKRK